MDLLGLGVHLSKLHITLKCLLLLLKRWTLGLMAEARTSAFDKCQEVNAPTIINFDAGNNQRIVQSDRTGDPIAGSNKNKHAILHS